MSASTRTVQQTLGSYRQIGAALVAVALAIALAAALAFSQTAVTQTRIAPAAGTAPVFVDHGSRDEIRYPGSVIGVDRAYNDYGPRDDTGSRGSVIGVDRAYNDYGPKGNTDKVRLDFGSTGPGPQPR